MKCVKGNKTTEVNQLEFRKLCSRFKNVVVDLGTGDGRFVYKNAVNDAGSLFIGIDPAAKQMEEFSKKATRKKLDNILFLVGSLEQIPFELDKCADKLYIILPWGSLLKAIVRPNNNSLEKIIFLLKPGAELEIVFGYDSKLEPTEFQRLELEDIDQHYIEGVVIPVFQNNGLILKYVKKIEASDLTDFESTWGKKIAQRTNRRLYTLSFVVQ